MSTKDNDTASQILKAARKVFADFGFEGARIDEIARESGFNKAMIYYHFKNKESLYQAVIDSFFHSENFFKNIIQNKDYNAFEKLFICIDHFSESVELNRHERCSIIAREMVSRSEIFLMMRDKYWIPTFKTFRSILEEGKKSGEFQKKADSDFVVFTIFSHIVYYKICEVAYQDSEIFPNLFPKNNREVMLAYLKNLLNLILSSKSA